MAIFIGIGVSGLSAQAATDAPPAPGAAATVAPVAAVNAVFDSGAARGVNAADIPLSGTTDAADGTQIEARIVRADTGAQVHPWASVATASGGAWSGAFPAAQRSAHRLKAQVRVQGSSAAPDTMAGDFMVGHVVALMGQSEEERMFAGWDKPAQGPVATFADAAAGDSFFFLDKNSTTIQRINAATPRSIPLSHMADVFTRNAPGEKVLFVSAAQSGTDFNEMANDDDPDRDWNLSLANSIDFIRTYGADVGVVMSTWHAQPNHGSNYRRVLYPLFTGRYAAEDGGGTYALGAPVVVNGSAIAGRKYDHLLWDFTGAGRGLFDAAVTKNFFYGPHRFEDNIGNNGLNTLKQGARASIRAWVADPVMAPIMLPKGPEMIAYQNGSASTVAGGNEATKTTTGNLAAVDWIDSAHPSDWDPDGLPGRARHTAVAMLYALGLGPAAAQARHVPKFNRADWQTTHADLWYEAPDASTPTITTTRLARGADPIPDTFPHRTEVAGFYINAQPAQRVEIVGGRVRVYPDGIKTVFESTDLITYGLGGASGNIVYPDDPLDDWWMNLPIADMGIAGVEGVALEPMPAAADIANTLVGMPLIPLPAYVWGGSEFGPGVSGFTYRLRVRVNSGPTRQTFTEQVNGTKVMYKGNAGEKEFEIVTKDRTGVVLSTLTTGSGSFLEGNMQTLTVSIDLANGVTAVWIGDPGKGVRVDDTYTSSTREFVRNRTAPLVQNFGSQFATSGAVAFAEHWRTAIPNMLTLDTVPDLGAYTGATWSNGTDGIGEPFIHARSDGAGDEELRGTSR